MGWSRPLGNGTLSSLLSFISLALLNQPMTIASASRNMHIHLCKWCAHHGIDTDDILHLKQFLDHTFNIKDLGFAKYFCGLESQEHAGLYFHQWKYILDIISDIGLLHTKTTPTPTLRGHHFSSDSPLLLDPNRYCRLVERLLYVTMTHLNVTYEFKRT